MPLPYRAAFHPELAEDRPRCRPIRHPPRSFRPTPRPPPFPSERARRPQVASAHAATRAAACCLRCQPPLPATRCGRPCLAKDRHHEPYRAILGCSSSHTRLRSACGKSLSSFAVCRFASVLRPARESSCPPRPRRRCARIRPSGHMAADPAEDMPDVRVRARLLSGCSNTPSPIIAFCFRQPRNCTSTLTIPV